MSCDILLFESATGYALFDVSGAEQVANKAGMQRSFVWKFMLIHWLV